MNYCYWFYAQNYGGLPKGFGEQENLIINFKGTRDMFWIILGNKELISLLLTGTSTINFP